MRCVLCGLEGARRHLTHGGTEYGPAHDGRCHALVWEGYWHRVQGASDDEKALHAWEWRQQRALARGEVSREAAPKSSGERRLDGELAVRGWTDVARELE